MEKKKEFLASCGGLEGFKKQVENTRPSDDVIDAFIKEKQDECLIEILKHHKLNSYQISDILARKEVDHIMLATVRFNVLNREQQDELIAKNNGLLLETYLCPSGFFDVARRFSPIPEYMFIKNMVMEYKSESSEIFKIYVDNTCRSLLTGEMLDLFFKNDTSQAVHYIFQRAKIKRDWEKMFIAKASETLLLHYVEQNPFATEAAQLDLVKKSPRITGIHLRKHGLYPAAQQLFHQLRETKS